MNQIIQIIEMLEIIPPHWKLVPSRGKKPLGYQWEKNPFNCDEIKNQLKYRGRVKVKDEDQEYYETVPTGISLICGQQFNSEFLVALDVDGETACKRIEKMGIFLPHTIAFTSGRPCRGQYMFKVSDPDINLRSSFLETGSGDRLEFRGTNLASVLPPSIHPNGEQYYWLKGCSPQEAIAAPAPEWVIKEMSKPVPNSYWSSSDISLEQAIFLLHKISPQFADEYYPWIKIGTALKSVSESLFDAWDLWSSTSSKYKPGECAYKWTSFKPVVGVGTLYYYANISSALNSEF